MWNTKRNQNSFDPRGTLRARGNTTLNFNHMIFKRPPELEEYVHGHTLPIMLAQIIGICIQLQYGEGHTF